MNKMKKLLNSPFWLHRKKILCLIFTGIFFALTLTTVKINLTHSYEGIYLLKGEEGTLLELKDDLYLYEGHRYIAGFDFINIKEFFNNIVEAHAITIREPSLYFEWNARKGEGFVRNYLPGGRQLLTSFSRFIGDDGKEFSGLFVGGGLPAIVREDSIVKMNETGMAYYDGTRWFHIWCNVNEVIANDYFETVDPDIWKFLGSRVIHHNSEDLILESNHELVIYGVPLRMNRTAHFSAGQTFFVLSVRMTNVGDRPATYTYLYGDEPWLGNYGTSGGNVGWTSDGIYRYEGWLDTKKIHYAGLFDYGNDAIGESHNFTLAANFIAWFGDVEPSVFFSNGPDVLPQVGKKGPPLASNTRFIGVQWGPRTLQPGQTEVYTMAIGMADHDAKTGLPMIPRIDLKNFP